MKKKRKKKQTKKTLIKLYQLDVELGTNENETKSNVMAIEPKTLII